MTWHNEDVEQAARNIFMAEIGGGEAPPQSVKVLLESVTKENIQQYGTKVFEWALKFRVQEVISQDVRQPVIEPSRESWTVSFGYHLYDRLIENPTYDPINNLVRGIEVGKHDCYATHPANEATQDYKSYFLREMHDCYFNGEQVTHDELAERLYNG